MPRRVVPALASVLLLAACSTAAPPPPPPPVSAHAGHEAAASGAPGTPHPSAPEGADGTIELESDFVAGGSGVGVAEAIDAASTEPVLVTGLLLRDAGGDVWFCEELDEGDPPACGRPRLRVTNLAPDGAVFAPENAANTGAQTSGDVIWIPGQQLFGVVHPGR